MWLTEHPTSWVLTVIHSYYTGLEDLGQLVLRSSENFRHSIWSFWILFFPGSLIFLTQPYSPPDLRNKLLSLQGQHSSLLWLTGHSPAADLPTSCHTLYLLPTGSGGFPAPGHIKAAPLASPFFLLKAPLADINGSKHTVASSTWGKFRSVRGGLSGQGRELKAHALSRVVAGHSGPDRPCGKTSQSGV